MNNQEYIDTFDEVRDGYKKLHTMGLDIDPCHEA